MKATIFLKQNKEKKVLWQGDYELGDEPDYQKFISETLLSVGTKWAWDSGGKPNYIPADMERPPRIEVTKDGSIIGVLELHFKG
jgi:hypothetical protein